MNNLPLGNFDGAKIIIDQSAIESNVVYAPAHNNGTHEVNKPKLLPMPTYKKVKLDDTHVSSKNKNLACNSCRSKRVGCDRQQPCGRCISKGIKCETASLDLRKKRVKANEVDDLKKRILELENLLNIKESLSHESLTTNHDINQNLMNPSQNVNIIKSIKNFFQFLYPGLTLFIHRESFLYSFFNEYKSNYKESNYCSIELVYAVAALGSRVSDDLKQYSDLYFNTAKNGVLKNRVFPEDKSNSVSLITTVQTLLTLSLYELGNGNFNQCFYLSGIAYRVGFDMSFQLDPSAWFDLKLYNNQQQHLQSGIPGYDVLTQEDIEIRSRIYWGCYLTDHFICLVLGRNPTLFCFNSTIPDSIEMQENDQTTDFKFKSQYPENISVPLKQLIILSRIVEIFTKGFFIEHNIEKAKKLHYLAKFNEKLELWRSSLPGFLKWDKKSLMDPSFSSDPTITYFWYHYYIVVLTFNKPHVEENIVVLRNTIDSLEMMLENFSKFHDKFNLYQLFAVSIASNILLKMKNVVDNDELNDYIKNKIEFFNKILGGLSKSYDYAERIKQFHIYDFSEISSLESSSVLDMDNFRNSRLKKELPTINNSNAFSNTKPINYIENENHNAAENTNVILSMLMNNQYNVDVDDFSSWLRKTAEPKVETPNPNIFFNEKNVGIPAANEYHSKKRKYSVSVDKNAGNYSKPSQEAFNTIKNSNDFSLNEEVDEVIKKWFLNDDPEFEQFIKPGHYTF